jgi:hypothetical protein
MYLAYATALARIDNQEVNEGKLADYFVGRLTDPASSPEQRIMALRLVPATHKKLSVDVLGKLLAEKDTDLQRETVCLLCEHPSPQRARMLLDVARDDRRAEAIRALALVGLAERSTEVLDELLAFAVSDNATLRNESLRALVQTNLGDRQRALLDQVAQKHPGSADSVNRVLGKPIAKGRPAADIAAWLKHLDGPADTEAGRRIFFQPKLANCSRCHRVDGRGADVGPDLSTIGRTERRHLLESILQPSNLVAPHYQVWQIATADGKVHTGMLVHTHLDEYTYLDPKGERFKLNTRDIVESHGVPQSIMPDGLADLLTDQELRDLLAYLSSRR